MIVDKIPTVSLAVVSDDEVHQSIGNLGDGEIYRKALVFCYAHKVYPFFIIENFHRRF